MSSDVAMAILFELMWLACVQHLQAGIDRVTSTFELVQLAKAAGVAMGAINMCFDNEVRRVDHSVPQLSLTTWRVCRSCGD